MIRRLLFLIVGSWLCSLAGFVLAGNPEMVVPVDGTRFAARLISLDGDGQLTLDRSGSPTTIRLSDLVRWGTPRDARGGSQLVMNQGAMLVVEELRLESSQITFESRSLGSGSMSPEQLRGIIFRPPSAVQLHDALVQHIAGTVADDDRLLLMNGDELAGTITALDMTRITIDANVGEIEVATNRVAAVLLSSTFVEPRPAPPASIWVGLSDGSRVLADRAELDAESLSIAMPGETPWKAPAEALVWLQPLAGRVVYLSDLEAAGYRHIPLLDLRWEYHRDRNVLGTALRSGTRRYQKGLGMHSACRLTYRLDEPFSRFEADLALDEVAGSLGSVVYRVYVGTEERYASDVIRAGDAPVPISVDVREGRSLSLLIEFAERGDVQDHANWLDARLVR